MEDQLAAQPLERVLRVIVVADGGAAGSVLALLWCLPLLSWFSSAKECLPFYWLLA